MTPAVDAVFAPPQRTIEESQAAADPASLALGNGPLGWSRGRLLLQAQVLEESGTPIPDRDFDQRVGPHEDQLHGGRLGVLPSVVDQLVQSQIDLLEDGIGKTVAELLATLRR